jgi:hypothetical protein
MSWLESYYPPVQKNVAVIKFKTDEVKKEKVKVEKLEKIEIVKKEKPVEVKKVISVSTPVVVKEEKPIIEAVSDVKIEKQVVKKGPKKPRFEKGSDEARKWSLEMAIRRKVLKEMKPVITKSEEE